MKNLVLMVIFLIQVAKIMIFKETGKGEGIFRGNMDGGEGEKAGNIIALLRNNININMLCICCYVIYGDNIAG